MNDNEYLKLAVEQAKKSVEEGGFPAGAVVVKDSAVISEGVSLGFKLNDPTSHVCWTPRQRTVVWRRKRYSLTYLA